MTNIVSAIQMVSTDDVSENLKAAKSLIESAVSQHADFILLPENFALMCSHDQQRIDNAESLGDGPIQDFLSTMSKQNNVTIVGGTFPLKSHMPKKVFACSPLFGPEGKLLAHYNKIHLFDVRVSDTESYFESEGITPGDVPFVVDTPVGPLGMSVCYDVRFPELYRSQMRQGAKIFTVPSAFTEKTGAAHWDILLRARAIENLSYVIAANQGGVHKNGRRTYGHSMIISPWGDVLAQCGIGNSVLMAKIDLPYLDSLRRTFPVTQHIKLFTGNEDVL